ncbi:MAG TPA: GNAT family N-acetyltransferase [Acidimicrobiales bacterium]|nr:GNAT family N-acetyltransferase [Acidimicrobiales bacterium]
MDRDELLAGGDHNLAQTMRLYATTAAVAKLEDDGRLLLYSTSRTWPGPYHNGAMRLDRTLAPDEVLTRAGSFFASRPGYCVWIAAHADADLEARALETGYASVSELGTPRLAIEHRLDPGVAPAGVTLVEVTDDEGRLDYLAVTVDAFADSFLPRDAAEAQLGTMRAVCASDVRTVVARIGGRPVSGAMVVATGSVAGIQLVGTIPGARGRGLGELCTRWAVGAGFDLGARAVVLEASEAGEPLYLRLGFVEVSRYRWCYGPPASRGGGRERDPTTTPGRPT